VLPDVLFNFILNPPPVSRPLDILLPSAIGIIGVILGGLITGGANYYLAVRKEKADREVELEIRRHEKKRAARLLSSDLGLMAAMCKSTIEKRAFPLRPLDLTLHWDLYKDVIAVEAPNSAWIDILIGVKTFSSTQNYFAEAYRANAQGGLPDDVSALNGYRDLLENARTRVEELMK
jgi:hypothetical protein